MEKEYQTDILIAGGSFGGIAAALAAAKAGCRVIVTEETTWIGGQATAQGVPLDEHPWIEQYGAPASYREFRNRIRAYYQRNYPLCTNAQYDPHFNPGACWVSGLGFEPRIGVHVLEEMLAPYRTAGLVTIWTHFRATAVAHTEDRIDAVTFISLQTGDKRTVRAKYFLDATELGDLLELGQVEHVIGAESRKETGEPLALEHADPRQQQPFTHLIALDWCEDDCDHTIEKPDSYEKYRDVFEKVLGSCDSLRAGDIIGTGMPKGLFSCGTEGGYTPDLWNFRRYFYHKNFDTRLFTSDVTTMMVGNEYTDGVLCGVEEEQQKHNLKSAKALTLSLVYYLQTEAPHHKGRGFRSLRVRPDIFETEDGLAQYPYIREARRIRGEYTICEQDFLISEHPDGPIAYPDSVGVAGYRVDIHEKAQNKNKSITSVVHGMHWTQQIPLGALIPQRVENLLPACKNVAVTHVTNGAFRLHPVEWNIGEVAGALAAYCLRKKLSPREVRNTSKHLKDFQTELIHRGVELSWPTQSFGRSYFSHFRTVGGWYFGECDKLENSHFIPSQLLLQKGETNK